MKTINYENFKSNLLFAKDLDELVEIWNVYVLNIYDYGRQIHYNGREFINQYIEDNDEMALVREIESGHYHHRDKYVVIDDGNHITSYDNSEIYDYIDSEELYQFLNSEEGKEWKE